MTSEPVEDADRRPDEAGRRAKVTPPPPNGTQATANEDQPKLGFRPSDCLENHATAQLAPTRKLNASLRPTYGRRG